MGKYDDLKTALECSSAARDRDAIRAEEKFNIALRSCFKDVLNELMEIGSVFLGGRFFLKKGYRVRHYRGKDTIKPKHGYFSYFWFLEYQRNNGTYKYYNAISVELRPTDSDVFSLYITSKLRGPAIDKELGEKVLTQLKEMLEVLNSRISDKVLQLNAVA
jgi:hypothetical protein